MDTTKLVYMEEMQLLTHTAQVAKVYEENEKVVVELDETIFYPQGGGQPYDTGHISSEAVQFIVEEVRFIDGIVKHIGHFESGMLQQGDSVTLSVNEDRRTLHARLHSAGHVVDMAVYELQLPWIPGKGYHFPDGPYIEYQGDITEGEDREALARQVERTANAFINQGIMTTLRFMPKSEMHTVCHHVPDYLPENKPARVILYGDFGVPCGGTHIANLKDIGQLTIRKIGIKKGMIKVSYDVH